MDLEEEIKRLENNKMRYENMPRAELIAELRAWENKGMEKLVQLMEEEATRIKNEYEQRFWELEKDKASFKEEVGKMRILAYDLESMASKELNSLEAIQEVYYQAKEVLGMTVYNYPLICLKLRGTEQFSRWNGCKIHSATGADSGECWDCVRKRVQNADYVAVVGAQK